MTIDCKPCGTLHSFVQSLSVISMRHLLVTATVALLSACSIAADDQASGLPALNEVTQSRRFIAFQDAMEKSPNDGSVRWRVSNDVVGAITPIDTVFSRTDGWCRSYEQIITDGATRYSVVGIACRDAPQRWLVLNVQTLRTSGAPTG